jgi:hypothetical protein
MRLRLALLLVLATTGLQAQDFSSLEERMSAAEFRAAGLDKLSPEELAALNAWLRGRTAGRPAPAGGALAPAPAQDRIGFHDTTEERMVVSRIVGQFTGWDGKTRFELENGQVWQQAESATLKGISVDSPAVTIEPAFLGSWLLRVDGFNQRVRVRRIK